MDVDLPLKVSHHCLIYNTEYTINYIYMQLLDYHTQDKKIQYFYVHFLRFTFSYTIYKI